MIFSGVTTYKNYFCSDTLWGYEQAIKSIREATKEESNWLSACAVAKKFIPNPTISANIGLDEIALGSPQECVLGSDKKPVVALPVFIKQEPAKPKKKEIIKLTVNPLKKFSINLVV